MINPNAELFKWGPILGRPIYTYPFCEAFLSFPNECNDSWPDVLGFYEGDMILFVVEYPPLRAAGARMFKRLILPATERKKRYERWLLTTKHVRKYETLVHAGLSTYTDTDLRSLFIDWNTRYVDFWVKGLLPEIANWGGEQLLNERALSFNHEHFVEIFEGLSAPSELSFFQNEELLFLKMKAIPASLLDEALAVHQKQYYWLRNNYAYTKELPVSYFRTELAHLSHDAAAKKVHDIESHAQHVIERKKQLVSKYKISSEISDIAEGLVYCVGWQDLRKQFIFIANHIITQFITEISRRSHISVDELAYYTSAELIDLLSGKRIDASKRSGGYLIYYTERGNLSFKEGASALRFIEPYRTVAAEDTIREFKGMVVSLGTHAVVSGRAKILLTPDVSKMEQGDILVAPMTSPDFIVAMRKAAAIVTDEGGMTSHAAIVSRELKIPCVCATRIATKVLKDGDLVEVDAKNGIVRKI